MVTGKEIPLVQSIKLMKKDKNIYRCRMKIVNTVGHGFVGTCKVECEADIDFTQWPEAKDKKKIFVSIRKNSRSQAI
jgi:hypothetical protein